MRQRTVKVEDARTERALTELYQVIKESIAFKRNQDGLLIAADRVRIPTSDPHIRRAVWSDNGTLKISEG